MFRFFELSLFGFAKAMLQIIVENLTEKKKQLIYWGILFTIG